MTFKDKHFRQAFGPLLLSALMIVPTGCTEKQRTEKIKKQQFGLLDPTPIEATDEFGSGIVLGQANVLVYDSNGQRKKDQYVLTRGLQSSAYIPDTSRTFIRKAHINNSDTPVYVRVDRNGAIFTEDGFRGLFLKSGTVVIVSDNNVEKLDEYKAAHLSVASYTAPKNETLSSPKNLLSADTVANNDSNKIVISQSVENLKRDSSVLQIDTIAEEKKTDLVIDTLAKMRQNINE